MRARTASTLACLLLLALLPATLWLASPTVNRATFEGWIAHTPACIGILCINVFNDHVDFSIEFPRWFGPVPRHYLRQYGPSGYNP